MFKEVLTRTTFFFKMVKLAGLDSNEKSFPASPTILADIRV